MNSEQNVLDEIDALVDEQMANYANRSGYDHNINQDLCRICDDDRHTLAITERMREMRSKFRSTIEYYEDENSRAPQSVVDELNSYSYAADDSDIVCPGSDFIGPWANQWQLQDIRSGIRGVSDVRWSDLGFDQPPGVNELISRAWLVLGPDVFAQVMAGELEHLEVMLARPNPLLPVGDAGYTEPPRTAPHVPYIEILDETHVFIAPANTPLPATDPVASGFQELGTFGAWEVDGEVSSPTPETRRQRRERRTRQNPPMWADPPERSRRRDRTSRRGVGDWRRNG